MIIINILLLEIIYIFTRDISTNNRTGCLAFSDHRIIVITQADPIP